MKIKKYQNLKPRIVDLLFQFITKLATNPVGQLLVDLRQKFVCCSTTKLDLGSGTPGRHQEALHLLAATVQPLQVKHGRVFIGDFNLDLAMVWTDIDKFIRHIRIFRGRTKNCPHSEASF